MKKIIAIGDIHSDSARLRVQYGEMLVHTQRENVIVRNIAGDSLDTKRLNSFQRLKIKIIKILNNLTSNKKE